MTNNSVWPKEIDCVLKQARVSRATHVPDAGHAQLIELPHADPEIQTTVLTTEEEGIAIAAGAWLGGQRAVLFNMLSRISNCRFPLLMLVTMRGEWAKFNLPRA